MASRCHFHVSDPSRFQHVAMETGWELLKPTAASRRVLGWLPGSLRCQDRFFFVTMENIFFLLFFFKGGAKVSSQTSASQTLAVPPSAAVWQLSIWDVGNLARSHFPTRLCAVSRVIPLSSRGGATGGTAIKLCPPNFWVNNIIIIDRN